MAPGPASLAPLFELPGERCGRCVEAMEPGVPDLPAYPVLNALTAPLRRAAAVGRGDLLSEWCGQAGTSARPVPAGELVGVLMDEYGGARRAWAV